MIEGAFGKYENLRMSSFVFLYFRGEICFPKRKEKKATYFNPS